MGWALTWVWCMRVPALIDIAKVAQTTAYLEPQLYNGGDFG